MISCLFPESVKSLLGKHVKILLKNVVKLEIKADKTENRVLVCLIISDNFRNISFMHGIMQCFLCFVFQVFSPCRLFLLTAKVPTRVSTNFRRYTFLCQEIKQNYFHFLFRIFT